MPFETSFFINCPFDPQYKPIQKALILTVSYLGFTPLLSTNQSSSHVRIREIEAHIANSEYSIHDICRCVAFKSGDLGRFNMPYEFGIDIGCMTYGNDKQRTKLCLVMDEKDHRYHQVISYISGQDIKVHGTNPKKQWSGFWIG